MESGTIPNPMALVDTSSDVWIRGRDFDVTVTPSSNTNPRYILFKDKNQSNLAYVAFSQKANGDNVLDFAVYNRSSSNILLFNQMTLKINKDGTASVVLSHPNAWKAALGL